MCLHVSTFCYHFFSFHLSMPALYFLSVLLSVFCNSMPSLSLMRCSSRHFVHSRYHNYLLSIGNVIGYHRAPGDYRLSFRRWWRLRLWPTFVMSLDDWPVASGGVDDFELRGGDFLLCAWPGHLGVAGAALATSFATWPGPQTSSKMHKLLSLDVFDVASMFATAAVFRG